MDFKSDCESLCFDCGSQEKLSKISDGVALCQDCFTKNKNPNNIRKTLLDLLREPTGILIITTVIMVLLGIINLFI